MANLADETALAFSVQETGSDEAHPVISFPSPGLGISADRSTLRVVEGDGPSNKQPDLTRPQAAMPVHSMVVDDLAMLVHLAVVDLKDTVEKKTQHLEVLTKRLNWGGNGDSDSMPACMATFAAGAKATLAPSVNEDDPAPTPPRHANSGRGPLDAALPIAPKPRAPVSPTRNKATSVAMELTLSGTSSHNLVLIEDEQARQIALAHAERIELSATELMASRPPLREESCVGKVVGSKAFELVFATLILTNSLLIAAEVQWRATHLGEEMPFAFDVVGHVYSAAFCVELVMRILASPKLKTFFCGPDWFWAWMDLVVVTTSVFEIFLDVILLALGVHAGDGFKNIQAFRILRIVRVTRLMRALRLQRLIRFVQALRTLIFSIVMTLKSLVWAMVLLFMIMFVFAITITQATIDHMVDNGQDPDPTNPLVVYWGSLDTTMATLFQSIAGGLSWRDAVLPLHEVSRIVAYVFTTYIFFVYFAVLNVVTGVFCSSAIETAQSNPELVAHSLVQNREKYIDNLRWLFSKVDDDLSGVITINELDTLLNSDLTRAYFQAMELDSIDTWTLFKLIDVDRSGMVEIEEFISGCEALRGAAKSLDIANMLYENRALAKKLFNFMIYAESQFELLTGHPGAIRSQLGQAHEQPAEML